MKNSDNDNGIFNFNENGFTIETQKGIQSIQWIEIKSMLGYKEDNITTDSICLDVFCDNTSFTIREETSGWLKFLESSKESLPTIDRFWEFEIMTPAFERKLTVIYDRQNRSLKELEKEYYNS